MCPFPENKNEKPSEKSHTNTPHRQYPAAKRSEFQMQEFINEYDPPPFDPTPKHDRTHVPSGLDKKDRKLPPNVARGS